MKIKITEKQLDLILREQEDPLEKTLSSLEYATDKPFSCVQYEPIKIGGEEVFSKNYPKKVKYTKSNVVDDKKEVLNVLFFKEWKGTTDNVISLKFLLVDANKRGQQMTYLGKFKCTGRNITFNLDTINYIQAAEDGSTKEEDTVDNGSTPFASNPFSGTVPLKDYTSLDELGKEIDKITFDFSRLNSVV